MIVALPYTSIIEQNVKVYRDILGDDVVLEHHSAVDIGDDEEIERAESPMGLASENWDARIIVTTTVQLFESLFANSRSKTRKIHRLCKSVIVFDEIQAFPPGMLRPTLDVLRVLATPVEQGGYGATIVFCTATQPVYDRGPLADIGLNKAPEIVTNYEQHFASLRRVNYEWRRGPVTWSDLAVEIKTDRRNSKRQTLVVVNARKDALALIDALDGRNSDFNNDRWDEIWENEGREKNAVPVFHLSTLLCGAHRRAVLTRVRELLKTNRPVILVSTQVVECGVELDFPVVYRAIGPLDRIVQVAGRCNREGEGPVGRVIVFEPADGGVPTGAYREGWKLAQMMMKDRDPDELHRPELYEEYFDRLFRNIPSLDVNGVQQLRENLNFPETARQYRVISDSTKPIIVPFGVEWKWRLEDWLHDPSRATWQRLQPYLVNIFERDVEKQRANLEDVTEGLSKWKGNYDIRRHTGIGNGVIDPADLIL